MQVLEESLERMVLACLLREESFLDYYSSVVDRDMFATSTSKIIVDVYTKYVTQYNSLPKEEEFYRDLSRYFRKYGIDDSLKSLTIEYLKDCYELTYNVDYVKDNFIKFATSNKLTHAILRAAETITSKGEDLTSGDYESILSDVESAVSITARSTDGILFNEVADNPSEFIQKNTRFDEENVVATGLNLIDRGHIAGGPITGEMYVVSAPPGRGKSTLLVNIGSAALLQGKDVIHIFIGDNTEADGVLRYCARLTGVTMSQIVLNADLYKVTWDRLKSTTKLGNLVLQSYAIDGVTMNDIRSFVSRSRTKMGLDPKVLIVDYIDNCHRRDDTNSYEAVGDLYKKMKNICEEFKLVGWTASQPKIETWDDASSAGLGSLSESSMKQHIVDGMITLSAVPSARDMLSMRVPKMRRGQSGGMIGLAVDYERMYLVERELTDD